MHLLICPIDEEYSHIRVLGQLPNREYYYLLMNAWPKNKFTDRNNFIIRNKLTEQVAKVLGKYVLEQLGERYIVPMVVICTGEQYVEGFDFKNIKKQIDGYMLDQ